MERRDTSLPLPLVQGDGAQLGQGAVERVEGIFLELLQITPAPREKKLTE